MPLGGLLPYNDIGGLMGTPGINPMEQGGLLPPEAQQQIKNRTLLSLGLNMLANSGPSLTPTSLGQVIGQSGQQALSTGDQLRKRALEGALLRRKVSQEDQEQQRVSRLREKFGEAFTEEGGINTSVIPEIAKTDPESALALIKLVGEQAPQAAEPDFKIIDTTLPDGRKIKGRIDLNSPNPAATFQPVGAAETPPLPAEAAAKKAAIDQGLALIPEIEDILFEGEGENEDFQESAVMDTPFVSTNPKRRALEPLILSTVEAIIRAESGAAVPPEEIRRAAKRYIPSPLDTDKTARRKIDLLKDRLSRSQEAAEVGRPGARTTGPQAGGGVQNLSDEDLLSF